VYDEGRQQRGGGDADWQAGVVSWAWGLSGRSGVAVGARGRSRLGAGAGRGEEAGVGEGERVASPTRSPSRRRHSSRLRVVCTE
jgi:uncharacterized protein YjlB